MFAKLKKRMIDDYATSLKIQQNVKMSKTSFQSK